MQRKTKIIIASIVGAIVVIPIVLFIAAVLWVSFGSSSVAEDTGSIGATRHTTSEAPIMMDEMFGGTADVASTESAIQNSEIITTTAGSTAAEVDQKIIKTGYLDITVDAVDEVATKIIALATGKGGYTQSSSVSERKDGTKFGNITVRIPATEFENTMVEIKKIATAVDTESASGQDVTEEYSDLEAQLKNAQAQEVEYLKILNKAESVTEILKVQSYLGKIRGEIESLQGRIKYLGNLTSYSTITVSLSEEATIKLPSKEFRPWTAIKEAAQTLITVLQSLAITIIWLVILGGGILIPIVVAVWLVVWLVKKIIKKRQVLR